MKPKIVVKKAARGYSFEVTINGKVVASGNRSTEELANIAAAREAAVSSKVLSGKGKAAKKKARR